MKPLSTIKEFAVITLGTLIAASAVFFFLIPSCVSIGSISALAMLICNFIPLKISLVTFILNAFLLTTGFLLLGREFGVKTVYTSLMLPVMLAVYEYIFPAFTSMTEDPFLDTLCYIFVISIGQTILFNRNASSGGLDIIAKILNKYLRMDLGKAMSLAGMCVALSSAFVYDKKIVVLSILGTYLSGIVLDYFIFGYNIKKRVCIISRYENDIKDFIINHIHSGATIYESIGAYTNEPQREIITIVDKSEYSALMRFVIKKDPQAFITVYNVNEVLYQPKVR